MWDRRETGMNNEWTRRRVLDRYVLMALIALELLMSFSFLGY